MGGTSSYEAVGGVVREPTVALRGGTRETEEGVSAGVEVGALAGLYVDAPSLLLLHTALYARGYRVS